jgi:putative cell wall-binding protein
MTAALVTGGAVAFASQPPTVTVPVGPVAPSALRHALEVQPLALTPETRLLPAGSSLKGTLSEFANNQDWYQVPLHAGQHVSVKLTGPAGTDFALELWRNDPSATDPVADDMRYGYPKTIEFDVKRTDWYDIDVWAGLDSGKGEYTLTYTFSDPPVSPKIDRIQGTSRVLTAVALSKASYPATAPAVVVATGWNYADAIAASSLCGSYDAPLLLTEPTRLSAEVKSEVDRLKPKRVFVLGKSGAVSDAVVRSLEDTASGRIVKRIGGDNRFDTANQIAFTVKAHEKAEGRKPSTVAFLVDGYNFPDGLAVSPFAFRNKMPVFLASKSAMPPATVRAMTNYGVTKTFVLGSQDAISQAVMAALPKPAAGQVNERIYDSTRTGTAIAAARYATTHDWAKWSYVGLTNGWNYPDALAGGVAAGKAGGVLLLTDPVKLSKDTSIALGRQRARLDEVHIYGGTSAVFGCVMGDVDWVLDGTNVVDWH